MTIKRRDNRKNLEQTNYFSENIFISLFMSATACSHRTAKNFNILITIWENLFEIFSFAVMRTMWVKG